MKKIPHKKIISIIANTLWEKYSVCQFDKKIHYIWDLLQIEIIPEVKPWKTTMWCLQWIYIKELKELDNAWIWKIIKMEYEKILKIVNKNLFFDYRDKWIYEII